MNCLENIEEISCTLNATNDFTDWLNELKVDSIADIEVVGLHDKVRDIKREYIAVESVLKVISEFIDDGFSVDTDSDKEYVKETINKRLNALVNGGMK